MKISRICLAVIVLLIIVLPPIQLCAQQNPFLTTGDTESADSSPRAAEVNRTGFLSPFLNSRSMQKIKGVQKKFQAKISSYIAEYKNGEDSSVLFTFLLFSYFISSKADWKKGMAAGFMTAVLHAVSAVILIGGLYLITSKTLMTRFNNLTPIIEKISYGGLVLLGLYLMFHNIRSHAGGHSHKDSEANPGTILFVLAAGLIPCPGAATIMIFSIAVQAPLIGVYSVIAMSLGMGTVLALIPPAAIILQDRLNPLIGRWNPKTGERIHFAISEAGAVMMILLGILFLV